jgi:hypothetical protein
VQALPKCASRRAAWHCSCSYPIGQGGCSPFARPTHATTPTTGSGLRTCVPPAPPHATMRAQWLQTLKGIPSMHIASLRRDLAPAKGCCAKAALPLGAGLRDRLLEGGPRLLLLLPLLHHPGDPMDLAQLLLSLPLLPAGTTHRPHAFSARAGRHDGTLTLGPSCLSQKLRVVYDPSTYRSYPVAFLQTQWKELSWPCTYFATAGWCNASNSCPPSTPHIHLARVKD